MSVVAGTRRKEMSYGGKDKGIRQKLSRNIWTIMFILPLVILNVLRRCRMLDFRKASIKKAALRFFKSPKPRGIAVATKQRFSICNCDEDYQLNRSI
jgi:hypothetical protein